jgi:hypothetical protein
MASSKLINLRWVLSFHGFSLGVFSRIEGGSNVPRIVTEVGHPNIVHELCIRLLFLFDLRDKFILSKCKCRIERLRPYHLMTQTLVVNFSAVEASPTNQLFASQAIV